MLPPELLALVFEFIPHRTIRSCALVSRTWCLHARPHIFRHIHIIASKPSTERYLERLIEWKTQGLIPLILHVTLHGESDDPARLHSMPGWENDVAEELGRQLTHVETLNVYQFKASLSKSPIWDLESHLAFLKHLGSAKGGLRRVRLNQVFFASLPGHLFHYLAHVPGQPTELYLKDTGHRLFNASEYSNVASTPPSLRWQLTYLNLNATELRKDVISWLLSPAVDIAHLRSLVIAGSPEHKVTPDPTMPSLFEQLVVAIGPTIRKLTVGIEKYPRECTDQFTAEVVKKSTALEQLFVVSDICLSARYARILDLLPGLDGNTSLTEITVAFHNIIVDNSTALRNAWNDLDRELDGATLPGFRRLLILAEIVAWGESLINLENLIRAQIPRLSSRGLLEVRVVRGISVGDIIEHSYSYFTYIHS